MRVLNEEAFLLELAKLLIRAEALEEEVGCGEQYMQDIQPKDKTQNLSGTRYKFVEITLVDTG